MRRRTSVWLLATFVLITVSPAHAQLAKIPRIGFVSATGDSHTPSPGLEGFRRGLRNLGYLEGKNILIENRNAEGRQEPVPNFIAEFVQLKVDVIVVGTSAGIRAAKQATKKIPIVMVSSVDPVAAGTVDSLAHPGGNITGISTLSREISGKRLELIKEVVPKAARVGVLWHKESPSSVIGYKEYEDVARALKVQLQSLEVSGSAPDWEVAFRSAAKGHVSALIVIRSPVPNRFPKQIADLAIKYRLPAVFEGSRFVEAGGLMSYASSDTENWIRVATYVDKILKGTKPADLPVEQPMKFELVINLQAAKQIDLTLPQWTLMKADRVIR